MNGFDRLREQMKGQEDPALNEVVKYLLSRSDMEARYLNEEKTIEGMCAYIKEKGMKNAKNGWNFVSNEIVFAWAIMYFSLPDSILQINKPTPKKEESPSNKKVNDNVISIEDVKNKQKQLSLFGGES